MENKIVDHMKRNNLNNYSITKTDRFNAKNLIII